VIRAGEALERLRVGNLRFSKGLAAPESRLSRRRILELPAEQKPFAIILGCSDARVPAEIIFDQGLGDLFVIRVAGNVVAPSQIGSIEFAAARFGTRLVVVLGHSRCGAVLATLEELRRPETGGSANIRSIVEFIRPSVEPLLPGGSGSPSFAPSFEDEESLVRQAVTANVRTSVARLRHGSEVLDDLIQRDGLVIAGAEYSLETGRVEFHQVDSGGADSEPVDSGLNRD